MAIKKDLMALKKDLTAIGKKLEKLITAVEKSETKVTKAPKAKAVKAPSKKSVKATPAKKAPKEPVKKKAVTASATDQVLNIINGSKNGVDTATLCKKTGFDQKKVRNIVFRTMKQGKITRLEKGIYIGLK